MADTWQTPRNSIKSGNKAAKDLTELEKQQLELIQKVAESFIKKESPVAESFGNQIAGFISKAASAKLRANSNKPNPTPALSGPNAGKGNTKNAAQKTSLDAIIGSTSKSNTTIKKVIASGSAEGIRKAGQEGFNLKEVDLDDMIKQASENAEIAANDPATLEKFEKIGIPAATVQGLVGNLTSNLTKLTSENQGGKIIQSQMKASANQMKGLQNPFGSFELKSAVGKLPAGLPVSPNSPTLKNELSKAGKSFNQVASKNPFGSMGVDFGNIQASVTSLVNGLPVPTEIGKDIPVISGANNIASAGFTSLEVPNLVTAKGSTNLSQVVSKGDVVPDLLPSTPVEEIGVPPDRPVPVFLYTTVNSAKEIELEIAQVKRKIQFVVTGWSGSAIDKKYKSVKEFNERLLAKSQKGFPGKPEGERCLPCHYFILRDGRIERNLNTESPPKVFESKPLSAPGLQTGGLAQYKIDNINTIYSRSIVILFEGGSLTSLAETTPKTYSYRSITPEQFESYGKFLKACIKANPGFSFSDLSKVYSDWMIEPGSPEKLEYGPGFRSSYYAKQIDDGVEEIVFQTVDVPE